MAATIPKPAAYTVAETPGGYAVHRDGAALKTPAGAGLTVPSRALAAAMAAEMRGQGGTPDPAKLPLLQLAFTAIDIVGGKREETIAQAIAYAESDLLCHRARHPADLADAQQKAWQPMLDWCAKTFGAPLRTAAGIMPVAQPEASVRALRRAVASYDDFRLAGLGQAVGISGSLVLGLALAARHLTPLEMFDLAELDAGYQIKKWGEDPVARARHDGIKRDLALCGQWFGLLES